jgi:hypothetical protein
MDQTLRQALGLKYDDFSDARVGVHQLRRDEASGLGLSRLVGRRLVYCRPAVLHPVDIEKNVARVPSDVMNLLGVKVGERITVCGIFKDENKRYYLRSKPVAVMEAKDKYIEDHNAYAETSVSAHYPNIGKLICKKKDERDLYSIFVDADTRNPLFGSQSQQKIRWPDIPEKPEDRPWHEARFAQSVQPILAFREPKSAIAKQVFALAGGTLAVTYTLYIILSQVVSQLMASQYLALELFIISVFLAVIMSLVAVLIKTRSQL